MKVPAHTRNTGTMVFAACVMAIAAIYVFAGTRLPAPRVGDPIGPAAFPIMVGLALFAAAAGVFYEDYKKAAPRSKAVKSPLERRSLLVLAGIVVWTWLYYWAFSALGYLLATPVYLFALLNFFDRKKLIFNAAIAILFTIAAYALFSDVLGATLPHGILPQ